MARRRVPEEHENHEAWAIPYGDLVTLLLAFFVVMYAMSSVNQGKYRVLSDSLTEAFHGTHRPASPRAPDAAPPSPIEMPRSAVHRMIALTLPTPPLAPPPNEPNGPYGSNAPRHTAPSTDAATAALAAAAAPGDVAPGDVAPGDVAPGDVAPDHAAADTGAGAAAATSQLAAIADQVNLAMGALVASGEVRVRRYQDRVAVDISTDILFGSGVARLSAASIPALQHLADVLKPFPNALRVEGHTDDRPINTVAFPSNWELSAARAASVVHLFMDRGIAADRLAVMGFGPYRPAAPNDVAAGRNANRRVAVVILGSDATPDGRP